MISQWRLPPPAPFCFFSFNYNVITTLITILCNFRWRGNSRMLQVVWSRRVNGVGKLMAQSLGYNEVMETLTLWPGAACHRVCGWHWDWTGNMQRWGTARLRAMWPGCSAPGTSNSLSPEESTVWAQAAGFAPSACCPPSFWVPCSVTSFSLPLYFRGPLISSKYFFAVLKNISLNHGIAFWVSEWISKRCFLAAAMLSDTPFVRSRASQQNWTHAFQRLTWYVISYFILLSAWGSLYRFGILLYNCLY